MTWTVFTIAVGYLVALGLLLLILKGTARVMRDLRDDSVPRSRAASAGQSDKS